ncbi:hypothetical protein L1887_46731 [Cichorium endivia]|nr:hypothetical protein L1887_46731 [Cichorium endivia]
MLPIAVLPAAGLLLGIGGALSNPNTLAAYPFLDVGWLQAIFTIMSSAGSIVFANLSVLFAVGVAVGLAKSDKGTAGLAALLAFLVMNATINALLILTGKLAHDNPGAVGQGMTLGIQTLETGVFGGVVIGLVTCALHHRFNKIALPQFLGFFGGSRFVPIISSLAAILVGALMTVIWPHFQKMIFGLGGLVDATGYLGTLLYGFILRMLGPFGLHHIFYLPFWTTALGGSEIVNGHLVEGTQRIFFAQLADPNTQHFYEGTSRFMSGRFITMMFGLLGACLAMYHTAKPENKKRVAGLLLSAALTSFLTGITEPIEFSFLFIAPVLYVIHALFDGLAFMLAHMLQITIGQTFSGGFIDFVLFGILQGEAKTNWMFVPLVGVPWFFLYYFTFRYLINRFDFATPGREKEAMANEVTFSQSERAVAVIAGLGGKDNLEEVDCCATRLRVTVKDGSKVNDAALKATGARGVIVRGNGVQGKLVVSCQALENEPLHSPFIMSRMALAAAQGGAAAIRANSVVDIEAIKQQVSLPVIGIIKRDYPESEVFITATMKEVDELMSISPEIIALDATARERPGGESLETLVSRIRSRYPAVLLMADISSVDEAVTAQALGFDCVGTTLYGYTAETAGHSLPESDCAFLKAVLAAVTVPVVAEGNVDTPERAARCLALGAHTVVVGGAITRPQQITERFMAAIGAQSTDGA